MRRARQKMDGPEWIDVIDDRQEVYVTLTNNNRRGVETNPPIDAANPRVNNVYGHIVRWSYANDLSDPVPTGRARPASSSPRTTAVRSAAERVTTGGRRAVAAGRGAAGRNVSSPAKALWLQMGS
jgi:hypothetical protein